MKTFRVILKHGEAVRIKAESAEEITQSLDTAFFTHWVSPRGREVIIASNEVAAAEEIDNGA